MKVRLKHLNNVYEIVDAEKEELIGKKIILEFTRECYYFKKNKIKDYVYIIEDEIINEFNEIIGFWREIDES